MEHYHSIIAGSKLPDRIKSMLSDKLPYTIEELDEAYHELVHFLQHEQYYITLDRYEHGQEFLSLQTEPAMIARCRTRLNELLIELERLRPKEEAT